METLHHRLAAVWFADVVGFTRKAAEDEERALRVVRSFQEAARDVARRYDGRIVKFIGDAALAEFASTESGVRAALRLKAACAEHAARDHVECPDLRIAVHVGDVTTASDGDVYGDGVNVAARVVKEVEPGEVWVSQDVWRQLRQRPRFRFEGRGTRELKGVGAVEVYAVSGDAGEAAEEEGGRTAIRARSLLRELQRRHVYRVAAVYGVVGWLVIQVVAAAIATLGLPHGLARAVVLLVIVGFPVAVSLAWAYEITPQGIRRTGALPGETRPVGRRSLMRQAAVAVTLAGAVVAWLVFGPEKEAVGTGEPAAGGTLDPSRIAVLYFDDLSEGQKLGHLADGLTEALIQDLSQVDALHVISPAGVKPFRDAVVPLDSIARALGAGTLVEGTVGESGDRVRVTARLIDAEMKQLASVDVAGPRVDLFALQDTLVEEVSRHLRHRLGREIRLQRSRHATSSVEAWELVQRAEGLRGQAQEASDDAVKGPLRTEADSLLARAEGLDPTWIEPILLRGRLQLNEGTREALQRGLADAMRAQEIAPRDARMLDLRGTLEYKLAWQQSDSSTAAELLSRAELDLRTAIVADPALASARISLADLLYNAKWELPRALEMAQRAYDQDPFLLEEDHYRWLCEISLQLEDYREASRWCAEGRRRFPEKPSPAMLELYILASEGGEENTKPAWRLVQEISRLPNAEFNVPIAQMVTAAVLARAQHPDSALEVVQRARATIPAEYRPYIPYFEARVRLLLRDREAAIRLLREFLTQAPEKRAELAHDHWFKELHGNPRFEALVDRVHVPIFCQILCRPPTP